MAKITWSFPPEKELGYTGFKVYYGRTSHAEVTTPQHMTSHLPYEFYTITTPVSIRELQLPALAPGVWYFRVTAFSTFKETLFSEELSHEFVESVPAPDNLQILP